MELQGTLKAIGELQTFTSGFQKREAVILTEEQYPQPINIEFLQDKLDLLNNFKVGDKVKIAINIRGREWTSPQGDVKYFNSITGWRIDKDDSAPAKSTNGGKATDVFAEEDDTLPF